MVSETGVALAVVDPIVGPERLVLVVQEDTTNPKHGKVAGQWTVPMETCRAGESDAATLRRLVAEELANMAVWVEAEPFGSYMVMTDIEVRLYLGFLKSSFVPEGLWAHPCGGPLGEFTLPPESAETDGVSGHSWVFLENATGLWLRIGAREMLRDCRDGNRGARRTRCRANAPLVSV